jgi:putative membrane protein
MADSAPQPASDAAEPTGGGAEAGRTGMAAERTWLAWWRTALGATAGALAVGRLAPQLLHTARVPYVILGSGYAVLAVALLLVGARRQRDLQRVADRGEPAPLPFGVVIAFTVAGVLLAAMTVVLVIARS